MVKIGEVDRKLIIELWHEQRFSDFNLTATDRRAIEILDPGIKNLNSKGVDFLSATVEIGGKLSSGDIKIDVKSSDWYGEKSHLDRNCNEVILQTVFWDDDINLRASLEKGGYVPTLELLHRIDLPIGEPLTSVNVSNVSDPASDCQLTGKELHLDRLRAVFAQLGQERFQLKIEAMQNLLERIEFDQLFYEGIMEALGYVKNRRQFRQLAQRVPLDRLQGKSDEQIQAILFGTAGLLPFQTQRNSKFNEIDFYFAGKLEKLWNASGADSSNSENLMSLDQWSFSQVRPPNYPTRRIPAISNLLSKNSDGLISRFVGAFEMSRSPRTVRRNLREIFAVPTESSYWHEHSNFGTGLPRKSSTLIGAKRAADIAVNIVLPMVFIWAERHKLDNLQKKVYEVFDSYPKLQNNRRIRQLESQIFTEQQPISSIKPNAKIEQGMLNLHSNFCAERICDLCPIVEIT